MRNQFNSVDSVGQYSIAVYAAIGTDPDKFMKILINNRDDRTQENYVGIATWGMSGCHSIAFIGRDEEQRVTVLAMWHAAGGLSSSRVQMAIENLQRRIREQYLEVGNMQFTVILSSGNENPPSSSYTEVYRALKSIVSRQFSDIETDMSISSVHSLVEIGGSENAFAVSNEGQFGVLENISQRIDFRIAPRSEVQLTVTPPQIENEYEKDKRNCCNLY